MGRSPTGVGSVAHERRKRLPRGVCPVVRRHGAKAGQGLAYASRRRREPDRLALVTSRMATAPLSGGHAEPAASGACPHGQSDRSQGHPAKNAPPGARGSSRRTRPGLANHGTDGNPRAGLRTGHRHGRTKASCPKRASRQLPSSRLETRLEDAWTRDREARFAYLHRLLHRAKEIHLLLRFQGRPRGRRAIALRHAIRRSFHDPRWQASAGSTWPTNFPCPTRDHPSETWS